MPEKTLSPLLDDSHRQIIHTNDIPADLIPVEVWEMDDPTPRVYRVLVALAVQGQGEVVTLPARDELAQMCRTNKMYLADSLQQLHDRKLITIQNLEQTGRKERFRVIVKQLRDRLVREWSSHELVEKVLIAVSRTKDFSANQLDITCSSNPPAPLHKARTEQAGQFPPSLHALKSVCNNKDFTGKSLADISDQTLYELSGYAGFQEIEIAIRETDNFRPKNKKQVTNIAFAFRQRFEFDKEGRGTLRHNRSYNFQKPLKKRAEALRVVPPFKQRAEEIGATIFPDEFHDKKLVDLHCSELNSRGSVIRGETAPSIRKLFEDSRGIIAHPIHGDTRLVLHDHCELVQLEAGYWKVSWVKPTLSHSKRTCETSHIGEALKHSLPEATSSN